MSIFLMSVIFLYDFFNEDESKVSYKLLLDDKTIGLVVLWFLFSGDKTSVTTHLGTKGFKCL